MVERERIIHYDGMGDVSFRKSYRARRLTIRIKRDGQVKVSMPFLVGFNQALSFVDCKKDWILKTQQKIKYSEKEKIIFNEKTEFYTTKHKVLIRKYQGIHIRCQVKNGIATIMIPNDQDPCSQQIQEKIRKIIIGIWRIEAKEILIGRTYELAAKYNFHFSQVKIKNMNTRWGSCSGKNVINLNLHLVKLPEHLRDYVILHELVHTSARNHGKEFWDKLNTLIIDARKLSRELKNIDINF